MTAFLYALTPRSLARGFSVLWWGNLPFGLTLVHTGVTIVLAWALPDRGLLDPLIERFPGFFENPVLSTAGVWGALYGLFWFPVRVARRYAARRVDSDYWRDLLARSANLHGYARGIGVLLMTLAAVAALRPALLAGRTWEAAGLAALLVGGLVFLVVLCGWRTRDWREHVPAAEP